MDYRGLDEIFDAIVSVGMFEHVGHKNYRTYMEVVHRSLKPGGLFLLHTIGGNYSNSSSDPWIDKYIFPSSLIPSARQITAASEGLFVIEDWHSFGADYDKTLMAWHGNFSKAWPGLESAYGRRFGRMWPLLFAQLRRVFPSPQEPAVADSIFPGRPTRRLPAPTLNPGQGGLKLMVAGFFQHGVAVLLDDAVADLLVAGRALVAI